MYRVELYAQVRRIVFVEGFSEREAANTVWPGARDCASMLWLRHSAGLSAAPTSRRGRSWIPSTGIVDQMLIKRRSSTACATSTISPAVTKVVKDYAGQEMFVPLVHPPGDAQADFGEALVVIDGVQRKAHYLVVDLPHRDDAFVKACSRPRRRKRFARGTTQRFGTSAACHAASSTTTRPMAVARILGDGRCKRTRVFRVNCSRTIYSPSGQRQRQGKGGRTGRLCPAELRGASRQGFQAGKRSTSSSKRSASTIEKRLRRHTETTEERFKRDRQALLPLPPTPYDACDKRTTRVTSLSLVRLSRQRLSCGGAHTIYGHAPGTC